MTPIKLPPNRHFGLVFCVLFLIIALWPLFFGKDLRLWSLAVSVIFLLLALAAPNVLTPLNRGWMWLGLLLHRVTSPLILGLLFFVILTPVALLKKLFEEEGADL